LSQLLSKVTVTSCRYYIKSLNVSALLLDDALEPATPLTNGAINKNQLIVDEVKAYKNYDMFLGLLDVPIFPTPLLFRLKFEGVPFGVDPSYWDLQRVERLG